jgi:phage baseplate assembly protein W
MSDAWHALRFPIRFDPERGDLQNEEDFPRYVEQLVRQTVLLAEGERVNRPTLGCSLRRMLFAPNSPATASLLRTAIVQALDTWLGDLIRVEAIRTDAEQETLHVRIDYTLLTRQEARFLNLELEL